MAATFKNAMISSSSDKPQFDFTLLSSSMAQDLPYDIPTQLLFPIHPQNPCRPNSEFKTLKAPNLYHHTKKKTPLSLDLSLSRNYFPDHNNSSKKRPLVGADSGSKTPIFKKTPPTPVSLDLSLSRNNFPDHNSSKKRPLVADSGSKTPVPAAVSLDLSLSSGSSGSHHQENHNRMKFQVRPRNKNRTDRELLLGFNGPFWSIKKTLTKSDLGHLSRLIVASEDVQNSIIQFWDADRVGKVESEEGVMVRFWDCDTNSEHAMVFKRWKSSGSYVFNKNWIQQFVKRRGLKEGDQIGMSWDQGNSRFNFSLLKLA